MKVRAVIVTFNPDLDKLSNIVKILCDSEAAVTIIDNASSNVDEKGLRSTGADDVIVLATNEGVAAAFNHGVRKAIDENADFVLLMDQDGAPAPNMLKKLLEAHAVLSEPVPIAAVGPKLVDAHTGEPFRFFQYLGPFRCYHPWSERKTYSADRLMSSGSLIPVNVFRQVGLLDERFFIDCVDTEWCLRAKSMGLQCHGVADAILRHELGNRLRTLNLGVKRLKFYCHSPMRSYYISRNAWLMARMPHVPWGQKLYETVNSLTRLVVYPILSENKLEHLKWTLLGLVHGIMGKSGKYETNQ